MATADKKPAAKANTKKKPAAKAGVFDVAHPGKGAAASATARPVISSKGPVIQDPMVVNPDEARETAPVVESVARVRKTVIQPLHEAEPTVEEQPAEAEEDAQVSTVAESVQVAEPLTAPELTIPATETPKPTKQTVTENTTELEAESKAQTVAETEPVAEAQDKTSNDIEPNTKGAPPTTAPNDEDATAKIIKEHMLRIEKLVDSEEYFLPINAVQTRKSRKFVVVGILLIIILAIAWYNIALDAGLLPNLYNVPHTEFFTVK